MKSTDAAIEPRKRPRQKRSEDTVDVILEATVELLRKDGLPQLSTNRIAERAGVSIGSLYQYFPGKEAVLATLVRNMRREMLEEFEAAVADPQSTTLNAAVESLVNAALRHHLRDPELTRCLEQAEDALPLDEDTKALKDQMSALVVGVLKRYGVPDSERTAFDLVALSHGITHSATQAGQTDFEDLQRRVLRAVTGYLES